LSDTTGEPSETPVAVQPEFIYTVIGPGHVMVGGILSFMVIILVTATRVLPQASLAVHVSVTLPLQFPGTVVEKVELMEVPVIAQLPLNPLLNVILLGAGIRSIHVTVISPGAVMVGSAAGLT
jgi:hypothetical protein